MGKVILFFLIRTAASVLVAFGLFLALALFTLGAFPILLTFFPNYTAYVAAELLLLLGTIVAFLIPGPGSVLKLTGRYKLLVLIASVLIVNVAFIGYRTFQKEKVNSKELQKLEMSIQKHRTKYPSEWQKERSTNTMDEAVLAYLDAKAEGDLVGAAQYKISHSYKADEVYPDWVNESIKETARVQAEHYRAGRYTSDVIDGYIYRIIIEPHYLFVAVKNPETGTWNLWAP